MVFNKSTFSHLLRSDADLEAGQLSLSIDDRRAKVVGDFAFSGLIKKAQGAGDLAQLGMRGDGESPERGAAP